MNGERLALWVASGFVVTAVIGFAWMVILDWLDARRRKRRSARPTVPAPRERQPPH